MVHTLRQRLRGGASDEMQWCHPMAFGIHICSEFNQHFHRTKVSVKIKAQSSGVRMERRSAEGGEGRRETCGRWRHAEDCISLRFSGSPEKPGAPPSPAPSKHSSKQLELRSYRQYKTYGAWRFKMKSHLLGLDVQTPRCPVIWGLSCSSPCSCCPGYSLC